MLLQQVLLAVFLGICPAWKIPTFSGIKHVAAAATLSATVFGGTLGTCATPAHAANSALSGAMSAMKSETKRQQEFAMSAKSFDEMSASAKKRFALEKCKKDAIARKAAGYASAAECTTAVLGGNYATIVSGRDDEPRVKFSVSGNTATVAPPAERQTGLSTLGGQGRAELKAMLGSTVPPAPDKAPAAPAAVATATKPSPTLAPVPTVKQQRERMQDLSGISQASKRRRALQGCKDVDLRRAAGMASATVCTERVLKDDFAQMIEALEYQ